MTVAAPIAAPFAISPALGALKGVRHGFFGRQGGVSSGIYSSLNARLGSNDDPAAVKENRARIASALGVAPDRLLSAHQIHSALAVVVEGPWTGPRPHVDAVVTRTPGLAVGVATADCAPVLLAEPQAGVIAAAHAGWRGAIDGVLEAALDAMEGLGADRNRIVAAIGACISPEAYEVGPEFKARFLAESPTNAALFRQGEGDRSWFDLPGYVVRRLARAGVTRVEPLGACTVVSDAQTWFSHRRAMKRGEPDYGCQLAAIALAPTT
jgi:YfiH family protein